MAFETIDDATRLWIKGREFSLARLLGDTYKSEASRYHGGAVCIFRLAPQDYHRFHSPADITVGEVYKYPGYAFSLVILSLQTLNEPMNLSPPF